MSNLTNEEITKAVALFYDGNNSPIITAKGEHEIADDIIALAKSHDVPLCDNALLVELLCQLEIGDNIPEHLYKAIAHILAFAYQMDTLISNQNAQ